MSVATLGILSTVTSIVFTLVALGLLAWVLLSTPGRPAALAAGALALLLLARGTSLFYGAVGASGIAVLVVFGELVRIASMALFTWAVVDACRGRRPSGATSASTQAHQPGRD